MYQSPQNAKYQQLEDGERKQDEWGAHKVKTYVFHMMAQGTRWYCCQVDVVGKDAIEKSRYHSIYILMVNYHTKKR